MVRYPILIFLLFFSVCLKANCDFTDQRDPDDWMDSIGKSNFCKEGRGGREDFGGGQSTSNGGNNAEGGRAVVVGTNGKIFVAGRTLGANNDFLIFRYHPDGSLDSSFETDGKVTHSFGGTDDIGHAIAQQTNGNVIIAGRSDVGVANAFDFAVVRLKNNGDLETSFDTDGKKTLDITGSVDIARAVFIQSDGLILLAGYGKNSSYNFAFARLLTSGEIDTSFSTDGKATFANGNADNGALAVSVDSNGAIIGAGNSYNGSNWDFASLRLLASGSLDTTFSTDGLSTMAINSGDESVYAVSIASINQPVLAGSTNNGSNLDFALVRLLTSGALDTSFNTSGKNTLAIGSDDDAAFSVYLQTDATVVLSAGYTYNGTNNDFAVVRIKTDGVLDTSFSTSGKLTQAIGTQSDIAQAVAMSGDGLIIAAGRTDTNGSGAFDFAMLRLGSDGSIAKSGDLVQSFGTGGKITFDFGTDSNAYGITADTQGRLVVFGKSASNSNDFAMARILVDGNLDTAFHTDGKRETDFGGNDSGARSVTFQYVNGKIVTCGTGAAGLLLARYEVGGALDSSFDTDGLKSGFGAANCAFIGELSGAGPFPKLFTVAGTAAADTRFSRFLTNGVLDSSFNTNGARNVSMGGAEVVGAGNSYRNSLALYGLSHVNGSGVYLARLLTNGGLDSSFASDGTGTDGGSTSGQVATNLHIYADNRSLVASYNTASTSELYLSRMISDGSTLDTTFSTNGLHNETTQSIPYGINVTDNDKILALTNDGVDFKIFRYTTDGALDSTFASTGSKTVGFSGSDIPGGITVLPNGWICSAGTDGNTDFAIACLWP